MGIRIKLQAHMRMSLDHLKKIKPKQSSFTKIESREIRLILSIFHDKQLTFVLVLINILFQFEYYSDLLT